MKIIKNIFGTKQKQNSKYEPNTLAEMNGSPDLRLATAKEKEVDIPLNNNPEPKKSTKSSSKSTAKKTSTKTAANTSDKKSTKTGETKQNSKPTEAKKTTEKRENSSNTSTNKDTTVKKATGTKNSSTAKKTEQKSKNDEKKTAVKASAADKKTTNTTSSETKKVTSKSASKSSAESKKELKSPATSASKSKSESSEKKPVTKSTAKKAEPTKESKKTATPNKTAAKASAKDETVAANAEIVAESSTRTGKFEIKKSKDGRFVFNLYASNSVIVATSQVYSSSTSAMNGIKSVIANASIAQIEDQSLKKVTTVPFPKWEIYQDKGEQYRFRLCASNGSCVVHSQGYTSKANCKKGIESIIKFASDAEVTKVYLEKKTK